MPSLSGPWWGAPGLCALLLATSAGAQERFDHRGAVGLLLGGGLEHKDSASNTGGVESGFRYDLDLGGTIAVDEEGNELLAFARGSFGGREIDWSLTGGYRGYFGRERVKTFFDLDVAAHVTPELAVGPRVGFGLQYELSPLVGLFAGLAAQLGFGAAFRFDVELIGGLQLRSYLLE